MQLANVQTILEIKLQDIVSLDLRREVVRTGDGLKSEIVEAYCDGDPVDAYKVTMTDGVTLEVVVFPTCGRAGVAANSNAEWFDASTVEEALEAWEAHQE
jgi:hypothetical protein